MPKKCKINRKINYNKFLRINFTFSILGFLVFFDFTFFYVFVKKRKRKMKNSILRLRFISFYKNVKKNHERTKNMNVKNVKKRKIKSVK